MAATRLSSTIPIPKHIWERLQEFLATGKTGQLTLNVSQGRVLSCDIREHLKLTREDPVR